METWDQILQLLINENEVSCLQKSEENEFKIMDYFFDNVHLRKQLIRWLIDLKQNHNQHMKNAWKSEQLRKQGNEEFQSKNFSSSIKYYTLSLQYAPFKSENVPLAFGNRSAGLFHSKKYEACTRDIESAIQHDYPDRMVHKLYLRAAHCYLMLNKKDSFREALRKVQKCLENDDKLLYSSRESIEKEINILVAGAIIMENPEIISHVDFKLPDLAFGEDPDFPSASIALDKRLSVTKGRHVVANRDIEKGQILFVEKPFAFVLLDDNSSEIVCAYCCKNEDVPVPCRFCTNTLYCTDNCREKAWSSYHQWECLGNQIGLWNQIGIAHLTIRTFLNCCYMKDVMKFNEIQKLVTNINKISTQDMFSYGLSVLMMTLYLSEFTQFFEKTDIYEDIFIKFDDQSLNMKILSNLSPEKWCKNLKLRYIGGILLRNMLQLICNGHAITRLNLSTSEFENIVIEQQDRVATAIYPSASMMNHSCVPNIINSFKNQYLIVKAIQNIPAGDEIFNCYGPHYRRMRKEERQLALQNQYGFTCECVACTECPLQNFCDIFRSFNCNKCRGPVILDNNLAMTCLDCKIGFVVDKNLIDQSETAAILYKDAEIYVQSGVFNRALENAKKSLDLRKLIFYKYHQVLAETYDLIGRISAILGRWLDCIYYLEHNVVAIKERFGPESIELSNELNKITDICIQYLREETNRNCTQYKYTLEKTHRLLDQAIEIFNLNYGPWNVAYCEIIKKQEELVLLMGNLT